MVRIKIVDEEDEDLLENVYQLRIIELGTGYRTTFGRFILSRCLGREIPEGLVVDHINRDALDNKRCNLREATRSQNGRNKNKVRKDCSSKFIGVQFNKQSNKWQASVRVVGRKRKYLGSFNTEEEAAIRYNEEVVKLFGDFAKVNNIYQTDPPKSKLLLLDDLDEDLLDFTKYKLYVVLRVSNSSNTSTTLHREVLKRKLGREDIDLVDHIDNNPLNNCRYNLRECNRFENNRNALKVQRKSGPTSSVYKGVSYHKKIGKWQSTISYNHKKHFLGYYATEKEAALAYNKKAKELCPYYKLNEVDEE